MPVLIDTHCHLYFDSFDPDRDELLSRMLQAGIAGAVLPALDMETAQQAAALCAQYPQLRYAIGIHPSYTPPPEFMREGSFNASRYLSGLWDRPIPPVAVGEIGLDGRDGLNIMPEQVELFVAQLRFAREHAAPVIVHLRDAEEAMLAALGQVPGVQGVFHCFGGHPLILKYAIRHSWFISFAGNLTFPKAGALREAALEVPLELLLVETDAPFLAPQPVRGKRNEPAYIVHTAAELARLRGLQLQELAELTTANAQRCFRTAWT